MAQDDNTSMDGVVGRSKGSEEVKMQDEGLCEGGIICNIIYMY